jgi:hypothetical protein
LVLGRLGTLPADPYLRLAAWATGAGLDRGQARALVGAWKGSKRDQARVAACVDAVARLPRRTSAGHLRFWVAEVGREAAADGTHVAAALWPRRFAGLRDRLRRALRAEPPLTLADLAVNGNDLAAIGLQGRQIGAALDRLLTLVLERPSRNRKSTLLGLAHSLSTTRAGDTDPDR